MYFWETMHSRLIFPQSLTSTVLEGKIREPPHVPESHRISHHGENKIQFIGPVSSGLILISLFIVIIVSLRAGKRTQCFIPLPQTIPTHPN